MLIYIANCQDGKFPVTLRIRFDCPLYSLCYNISKNTFFRMDIFVKKVNFLHFLCTFFTFKNYKIAVQTIGVDLSKV